ncbi:epidermal growth factor-like protein 6 isoform X1 [Xenopus laevis]|uniref:Epidermal growth factor-like protein 6 isoform X1 n=1 Tax=Xenopus laevis TaxID=8355 RepID=A0A8J1M9A4_XENLA|nr:epidermal growth factor-like protein 6 isoform X1 [Xenopus laevis]
MEKGERAEGRGGSRTFKTAGRKGEGFIQYRRAVFTERRQDQGAYTEDYYGNHRQLITSPSTTGVCRYGIKTECCYGWKRNRKGQCEAVCEQGCKHGECVGPNKCKCIPGFTGKTCNQDLNECGLKPRPCEHRCMNTHGSYKCYCLNGYMLMPDGSCSNSRTCAMANCQYGCEQVKGDIRCLCPSSGLQLGPDGRTCIDIDECAVGKASCPINRRCVNTFGSYYCKCQIGYELKYVNRRYDCIDINECLLTTHKCSINADCLNTQGSFKCRCKQGFKGNGQECSAVFDKPVKESPKFSGSVKDAIKKLLAHKNSLNKYQDIKNVIPEKFITPPPKNHLQPFDYEDEVYIGGNDNEEEEEIEELDEEEEGTIENVIEEERLLRGDVFAPQVKRAAVLSSQPIINTAPVLKSDEVSVDCRFDQGTCEWKQDSKDDFDWKHADRHSGIGYYMSVPASASQKKGIGRLKLQLTSLNINRKFCLTFIYRLVGERVGKLRVYIDENITPIWEETRNRDEGWRTAKIEIQESNTRKSSNITFEALRGKSKAGEMALDNVFISSGPCSDD